MKPRYNIIPLIEYTNSGSKKYFDSYLHVGNKETLGIKHNFDQSLELRYIAGLNCIQVDKRENLCW